MNKELVFLLHGLYMNAFIMSRFARYLRKSGFDVVNVEYNSVNIDSKKIFESINNSIKQYNPSKVHFVGHSLGGLLIRQYLENNDLNIDGRVVTLGTPHQTASIAKRLKDLKMDFILGNSKDHGLIKPLDNKKWKFSQEIGTVSGIKSIGAYPLFFYNGEKSDGTVTLSESKIEGATDTIELDVNHTGLIHSRNVMKHSVDFLKNGKFN